MSTSADAHVNTLLNASLMLELPPIRPTLYILSSTKREENRDKFREWTGLEFGKGQRTVENGENGSRLVANSRVVTGLMMMMMMSMVTIMMMMTIITIN